VEGSDIIRDADRDATFFVAHAVARGVPMTSPERRSAVTELVQRQRRFARHRIFWHDLEPVRIDPVRGPAAVAGRNPLGSSPSRRTET
jgi:hypothetical protein